MDIEDLRSRLPAVKNRVYLNTGTSGPMPLAAAQAETDLLHTLVQEGFSSPPAAKAYFSALDAARQSLGRVMGCSPESVALTHSASEGLGIVAAGLPWQPGDEIVISDLEHISGVAPWLHLAKTKGVRVVNLESREGYLSQDAVAKVLSPKTRLVCLSHVSYATGALLPVEEVCRVAKAHEVMVVVDGAQAAGQLPLDVGRMQCDFYALPGQKWLLGPEGTGALYVAPGGLDRLEPSRVGWASLADEHVAGLGYELSPTARRFETGTIHAPAFAALTAAIRLLEGVGWEAIYRRAIHLSQLAREALQRLNGVRVLSPAHAPSGLLTFSIDGADPDALAKALWEEHRIVIRSIPFPRALRASFHAFNTEDEVARLVSGLNGLLS